MLKKEKSISAVVGVEYFRVEPKNVKKTNVSGVPVTTHTEGSGSDDESDKAIDAPIGSDEEQAAAALEAASDFGHQFQLFKTDKSGHLTAMNNFLHRWFSSFTREHPGDGIKYNGQSAFYVRIMQRLRILVDKEPSIVNFSFNLRKMNLSFERPFDGFQTTMLRRLYLTDVMDGDVLLFSTADLACLWSALNSATQTAEKAQTRATGASSREPAQKVVGMLTRFSNNAKTILRTVLIGNVPLTEINLLYTGEPLFAAVDKFKETLLLRETGATYAPHAVGIYYDFVSNRLLPLDALDCNVPTALSLDLAFASMLTHPERIVLLDLRKEFKQRRGWLED